MKPAKVVEECVEPCKKCKGKAILINVNHATIQCQGCGQEVTGVNVESALLRWDELNNPLVDDVFNLMECYYGKVKADVEVMAIVRMLLDGKNPARIVRTLAHDEHWPRVKHNPDVTLIECPQCGEEIEDLNDIVYCNSCDSPICHGCELTSEDGDVFCELCADEGNEEAEKETET